MINLSFLFTRRGIPCGISFPKDYCSTIPSKATELEGENEQPPVQERHTYFHMNPNSPPKPLRKFNRATKPPARYKNGRLALRLRHRPVLCSKCKAYCEEKNPPRNAQDTTENGDSQSARLLTRRNEPKSKAADRKSGDKLVLETASDCQNSKSVVDTEDYTYSVVGPNGGVVENYWKRPNPAEIIQQEKTRHSVKTDEKGSAEAVDPAKSIQSLNSTDNNQIPSFILLNPSEAEHLSSSIQSKRQNLKFCIKKLQLQKQSVVPNINQIPDSSSLVDTTIVDDHDIPAISRSSVVRESAGDVCSTDEKSRKRSTAGTVPARFRDAKNVFDFKRRRQGSKVVAGLDLASALVTHLSSPIHSSTAMAPSSLNEPEEDPTTSSDVTTTAFVSAPSSGRTSAASPSTKRLSLNPASDVARTPTIKISYGSSGKGVVIEIPSKPTVEAIAADPMDLEKAEKKAHRKAKKQAKRKMAKVSEDPGCSSLPNNALSNSYELSSSHSSCSSPPPPLLTPISELCPAVPDEDYPISLDHQCPPLIHFTKEIPLSPKKRKKEKKHKKYRGREDDATLVSIKASANLPQSPDCL